MSYLAKIKIFHFKDYMSALEVEAAVNKAITELEPNIGYETDYTSRYIVLEIYGGVEDE